MFLVPKDNSFDLFDNFLEDEFFRGHDFMPKKERSLMKTDIKEQKDKYLLDIDLPGFDKENIHLSLTDGYLNIKAKVKKEENSKDDTKYIRKERYYGECSRSFYVGDNIKEEDIKAEFKNGILKIDVPKKEEHKELQKAKHIEIQ
jgi:HSP20 family molecular chaperone IbpA